MDVDYIALRALTGNLQNIRMKGVSGEHVGTITSFLKGALILLENYNKLPTNNMGLL